MVKRMKHLIALTLALAACSTSTRTDPDVPRVAIAADAIVAARTTEIAERREQMLAYLHDYQVAGEFPTDAAGMPLSVFRDDNGIRCPMAELIYRSGRGDLVDAVVAEKNDISLADVHTGPLADWMATSGLTRDEIIMIQGAPRPWEYSNFQFELAPQETNGNNVRVAVARERVRGRIEMAEDALRKDTAAAVRTLAKAPKRAATPGPVVPKAVTAAVRTPKGSDPVVVRTAD
jgi:hypothetical protein